MDTLTMAPQSLTEQQREETLARLHIVAEDITQEYRKETTMKRLLSYLEKHGISCSQQGVKIRVLTPYSVPSGSQRILQYQWETIDATFESVRAYLGD